eukprot:scaffold2280_cov430-Prasinococcus_capsulatus_cf.AAC.30
MARDAAPPGGPAAAVVRCGVGGGTRAPRAAEARSSVPGPPLSYSLGLAPRRGDSVPAWRVLTCTPACEAARSGVCRSDCPRVCSAAVEMSSGGGAPGAQPPKPTMNINIKTQNLPAAAPSAPAAAAAPSQPKQRHPLELIKFSDMVYEDALKENNPVAGSVWYEGVKRLNMASTQYVKRSIEASPSKEETVKNLALRIPVRGAIDFLNSNNVGKEIVLSYKAYMHHLAVLYKTCGKQADRQLEKLAKELFIDAKLTLGRIKPECLCVFNGASYLTVRCRQPVWLHLLRGTSRW